MLIVELPGRDLLFYIEQALYRYCFFRDCFIFRYKSCRTNSVVSRWVDALLVQCDDAALSRGFQRFERVYRDRRNRWPEVPTEPWRSMAPTTNADKTRPISGLRSNEVSY